MVLCKTEGIFLGRLCFSCKFKEETGESLTDVILKEKTEKANASSVIRISPSPLSAHILAFPFRQYGNPFQIRKHFCRALYSPNAKIVVSSDNMVSGVTETSVFPARLMPRMLMPNFLRTFSSPTLFPTHASGT